MVDRKSIAASAPRLFVIYERPNEDEQRDGREFAWGLEFAHDEHVEVLYADYRSRNTFDSMTRVVNFYSVTRDVDLYWMDADLTPVC
jgi:hypothetical protein